MRRWHASLLPGFTYAVAFRGAEVRGVHLLNHAGGQRQIAREHRLRQPTGEALHHEPILDSAGRAVKKG